jgi:DNA helicase INO80
MPTLFDSHNEFYEWFSKDIENHAENNAGLNEHQLQRLHMILKPFMLRRVKKDVENEMPSKTEVEVKCELTSRQEYLYRGIKNRISVAELLDKAKNEKNSTHLMNLIMQFRKVCNHPDMFDTKDTKSPFFFSLEERSAETSKVVVMVNKSPISLTIPRLIYREGMLQA